MGLKDSVFASKSERRGFQQIDSEWGHKYSLYPNLPFSIIFEPDKPISGTSNLFFKTSIDYTLCGKNDKPLLAIDFDGLGHGFNRGTEYAGVRTTSDPYRKAKFEFKLDSLAKRPV